MRIAFFVTNWILNLISFSSIDYVPVCGFVPAMKMSFSIIDGTKPKRGE